LFLLYGIGLLALLVTAGMAGRVSSAKRVPLLQGKSVLTRTHDVALQGAAGGWRNVLAGKDSVRTKHTGKV